LTSRPPQSDRLYWLSRLLRPLLLLAGLAGLAACASQQPAVDNRVEAQHYAAVARGNYKAPGTAEDPWGPYIIEASARYDVPQSWIRGVMHQESGGLEYRDGVLTISDKGAMGLMQVMPETYDELRGRYALGDDPYDPHNNILAGVAYMRELYDLYGSPGFLAAYNCGPGRLDKYLAGTATLPDQTRQYVALIGPNIQGEMPVSRSPAEQLALNQLPLNIPGGLRYARSYAVASRRSRHSGAEREYAANAPSSHLRYPMQSRYAVLSDPGVARVSYRLASPQQAPERDDHPHLQFASASPRSSHGFHLISSASAEPMPLIRRGSGGTGGWGIQVGAFGNEGQARAAAESARGSAGGRSAIGAVHQARGTLFRARLTGLSREAAVSAC
jgi:hypothetical protein